jgi:hypothetical protein
MKINNKHITTVISLVILGSCDAPSSGNSQRQVIVRDQSSSRFDNTPTTSPVPTTPTTPTSSLNIPSDASHCSWSEDGQTGFMHSATHLSATENRSTAFTACKSNSNNDTVYFQLEEPITDTQLCFIPMHQQGASSTYLGVPRCLNATDNKKIYTVRMYKDRPGFQNLDINGVMIIKDKSYSFPYPYSRNLLAPDAFLECNQQLTHPVYPNSYFCDTFISVGHYHFHKF